jgi:hypothetical protein
MVVNMGNYGCLVLNSQKSVIGVLRNYKGKNEGALHN